LGVALHFIPAGWTDERQLLDCYVCGALKSIYLRLYACYCTAAENASVRKADTVSFLIESWDLLEVAAIEKGWGVYEDELGDMVDDDEEDPTWAEE
jgi:hypothetical protein